jgi:hypothetical protein
MDRTDDAAQAVILCVIVGLLIIAAVYGCEEKPAPLIPDEAPLRERDATHDAPSGLSLHFTNDFLASVADR